MEGESGPRSLPVDSAASPVGAQLWRKQQLRCHRGPAACRGRYAQPEWVRALGVTEGCRPAFSSVQRSALSVHRLANELRSSVSACRLWRRVTTVRRAAGPRQRHHTPSAPHPSRLPLRRGGASLQLSRTASMDGPASPPAAVVSAAAARTLPYTASLAAGCGPRALLSAGESLAAGSAVRCCLSAISHAPKLPPGARGGLQQRSLSAATLLGASPSTSLPAAHLLHRTPRSAEPTTTPSDGGVYSRAPVHEGGVAIRQRMPETASWLQAGAERARVRAVKLPVAAAAASLALLLSIPQRDAQSPCRCNPVSVQSTAVAPTCLVPCGT